jgi:hypothetical protein
VFAVLKAKSEATNRKNGVKKGPQKVPGRKAYVYRSFIRI